MKTTLGPIIFILMTARLCKSVQDTHISLAVQSRYRINNYQRLATVVIASLLQFTANVIAEQYIWFQAPAFSPGGKHILRI